MSVHLLLSRCLINVLMRDCGRTTLAWRVPYATYVNHFTGMKRTGAQQAALASLPLHL